LPPDLKTANIFFSPCSKPGIRIFVRTGFFQSMLLMGPVGPKLRQNAALMTGL